MSITAAQPTPTPIPVQLSNTECTALIFPQRSMPKRGPKCQLDSDRVFKLILWVLDTGMPWQCVPVPQALHGNPARHSTTVYKVFATWAEDGSRWQAFIASVTPLSAEKPLDLSILHGDGTNTVAKTGGMGWGIRGANTRRAKKSSRSPPTMAMSELPSPWLPCMQQLGGSFPRA
jgi:transposase